ncbi:MAG: hypothetical protein DRJ03_19240 [Chloroflexi bacterium]|nr:MAG: hypothetical protein DRJ03_19240 [Chloroflexota bacterium]
MTTYIEYVDGLEAIEISTVKRRFLHGPPRSLNTADLPAQWVQLPEGESEAMVLGDAAGSRWPVFSADLIIAMEAVGQDVARANFDGTVALMEAVRSALENTDLTEAPLSWTMRQAIVTVAGNDYWGVVCSVKGQG